MLLGEFVLSLFQPLVYVWGIAADFFQQTTWTQALFWFVVVCIDLSMVLLMYHFFGKVGLYAAVVLDIMLCNIMGPKITYIFGLNTTMGAIIYAGIYFATDLLGEKYGKREANRAVMVGFAAAVMTVLLTQLSLVFEPTTNATEDMVALAARTHEAQSSLFSLTPTIFVASLTAYLVSQLHDVWIYHVIKDWTKGKHLWLRNNGSTMISQAIDTAIFAMIGWTGMLSFEEAVRLALATYMFKFMIALLDTPFIYIARSWDLRHRDWHLGMDEAQPKLRPSFEET